MGHYSGEFLPSRSGSARRLGTGPIWLDDLRCTGDEDRLDECPHTKAHNCQHDEDVGLACTSEPPQPRPSTRRSTRWSTGLRAPICASTGIPPPAPPPAASSTTSASRREPPTAHPPPASTGGPSTSRATTAGTSTLFGNPNGGADGLPPRNHLPDVRLGPARGRVLAHRLRHGCHQRRLMRRNAGNPGGGSSPAQGSGDLGRDRPDLLQAHPTIGITPALGVRG